MSLLKTILFAVLLLNIFTYSQTKPPVILTSSIDKWALTDENKSKRSLEQDRRTVAISVEKSLSNIFSFIDKKQYQGNMELLFREHAVLDPTNDQNLIKAFKLPVWLQISTICKVESIEDNVFPIVYHKAFIKMSIVNLAAQTYTFEKESREVLRPLSNATLEEMRNNRRSRDRAIELAIKKIAPQVLEKIDPKKIPFKLLALELPETSRVALQQLLNQLNSDKKAIITDIKRIGNSTIANVRCGSGMSGFFGILNQKMKQNFDLRNLFCEVEGVSIQIKLKKKKPSHRIQKFAGKLVLCPDPRTKTSLNSDQTILRDRLEENMENFNIYDATLQWEAFKKERQRLGELALVNPMDFLAQKDGLVTHTLYYWGKTKFKQKRGKRYCFGEIGVRLIRMVDAKQIASFRLSSEEEFKRGIRVDRDEKHARRVCLSELVQRVIHQKIISKLYREDPKQFKTVVPSIAIKATNFSSGTLRKLSTIFDHLEMDKKIKYETPMEKRSAYFKCDISFSKGKNSLTLTSFRSHLRELCLEEGFDIKIQSSVATIEITPGE